MRSSGDERSVSPSKVGKIYGSFTPSDSLIVRVQKSDGSIYKVRMNRRDRRRQLKRVR